VDLESADVYEVGADDSVDMDRAASPKRPRDELASSADTAATLPVDGANSGISSNGAAMPAAFEAASLIEVLNTATQSISAVVERLAEVAKQQLEATEHLAATELPSHHHQQQQQFVTQQQTYWREHLVLQQHVYWQQHGFHLQRQVQRQLHWQQQQQRHPTCWFWM
jgi:hypothetical protein